VLRYYLSPTSSVQAQQEKEREKAQKSFETKWDLDIRTGSLLPTVKTELSTFLNDFYLVCFTLITFCIIARHMMKKTSFALYAVKPLYTVVMITNV
jgi:hypothetical protein